MYNFTFHRPTTVRQAAGLLARNPEAKLLAGGHSLIPVMKQRLAQPSALIDLSLVEGLGGVEQKGRSIVIGAMTRHADAANSLLAAMYDEAAAIVRRGAPGAALAETRSALMRYRGQGHEIAVPLAAKAYRREDAGEIHAAFETAYRRLYSRVIPGVEVEVLSWVVLVAAPTPAVDDTPPPLPPAFAAREARRRPVFDPETGEFVEVAIYERPTLSPGATLQGPAVIVEDETSTVVGRNFDARIDAFGYIELVRR